MIRKRYQLKVSGCHCGEPPTFAPISSNDINCCKTKRWAWIAAQNGGDWYPPIEALFERLDYKIREEGFITEYDIIDELSSLEPIIGVDHIPFLQGLLELVVENVHPVDMEGAIVLGRARYLMAENLMKLAYAEEQRQKEGEGSRYFTEARLMQKISSDHFMHAGVLSIMAKER